MPTLFKNKNTNFISLVVKKKKYAKTFFSLKAPKITFVGDDENLLSFKITMPYIGIKLGRYKGLKIICGGTLFLSADDPYREMVEQGVIRLSMNDLYEHIIETSEFEFPQSIINSQKNMLLEEKQSEILAHGSTMEEYLEDECFTPEQFEELLRKKAVQKLSKNYLILKLCEFEGISATDAEVDEKIKQIALNENDTFENAKGKLGNQGFITIKHIIESDRAYDFLRNNNKFVFNEK